MSQPVLKGENGSWSPQGGGVSSACSHGGLPTPPHSLEALPLRHKEVHATLPAESTVSCAGDGDGRPERSSLSAQQSSWLVWSPVPRGACTDTLVSGTGAVPSPRLTNEEVRSLRLSALGDRVWGRAGVDTVCGPVSAQTQGRRSTPQGLWGCGGDSWRPGRGAQDGRTRLCCRGPCPLCRPLPDERCARAFCESMSPRKEGEGEARACA